MKIEISAGGVIVRKNRKNWEVLLISDMSNQWTFPKGLIEKEESTLTAARREIKEEVGLTDVNFMKELPVIRYMYKRNGFVSKVVYYFLFQTDTTDSLVPQKEEGISHAKWVPFKEAIKIIGYPETNSILLNKALGFLASQGDALQG